MNYDLTPFILSIKLASLTTIILFLIGIPISYYLAFTDSKFKTFVNTIITLPLVLPPSVIGFYFLLLFSPQNKIGQILEKFFNLRFVFSFEGLLLGSILFGLPFMINPIFSSFERFPITLQEAAFTMGKSKIETLIKIIIPYSKAAILNGILICFAHTIGEFGLVLMIGGSIPGKTKLASISIYQEVELMNYNSAHFQSGLLLVLSFILIFLIQITQYKSKPRF